MQFMQTFIPTAAQVGVLAMTVEFFLVAAIFACGGASIFLLATRNAVAPRHRAPAVLGAVIVAVTGLSYYNIQDAYHDMLHLLAATADPAAKQQFVHEAFLALGQYRYMAWAVTTPLLLLKTALMLRARPREMAWPLAGLLLAGFWMVLAGFLGEQQIGHDGAVLAGRRWLWWALAGVGYAAVVVLLHHVLAPRFGGRDDDEAGRAFRLMAGITVAIWPVYAICYLVPVALPNANLNWLHLVFTAMDLVTQIGAGMVGYLLGAAELERRVPHEAVQSARVAG